MSIKKFRPRDVLLNTMKTHPSCEFFVFDGNVYYNNTPEISGTYNIGYNASEHGGDLDIPQGGSPVPITSGYASLYEMNIDRISGSTDRFIGGHAEPNSYAVYDLLTTWVGGIAAIPGNPGVGAQYSYTANTGSALQGWWELAAATSDKSSNANNGTCTNCPVLYQIVEGEGPLNLAVPAPPYQQEPGWESSWVSYPGWAAEFGGDVENDFNIGDASTWNDIIGTGGTSLMSFSIWAYKTGGNKFERLFQFGDKDNATGQIWAYINSTGKIQFSVGWTTRGLWATDDNVITENTWAHIVIVYDATSASNNPTIYVNGESVALSATTSPATTFQGIQTSDCFIGNKDGGNSNFNFQGLLAQFAVYNQLLVEENVKALYAAGTASPMPVFDVRGGFIRSDVVDNGLIYPWITKDGSNQVFNKIHTASYENYYTDYEYGDVISSSYAMSASITREFFSGTAGELMTGDFNLLPTSQGAANTVYNSGDNLKCSDAQPWLYDGDGLPLGPNPNDGFPETDGGISCNKPRYRHYWALKSTLDSYGYMSEHFKVTASVNESIVYKDQQQINLISIPSIFYGTQIKPGTVSLKWYYTGSLAGELQDTRQNGELIQVSGNSQGFADHVAGSDGTGSVAGVVLYNEGFILLTGSWDLNNKTMPLKPGGSPGANPSWIYFGIGAADGITQASFTGGTPADFANASYTLSFKGTSEVQTMTMFANAKRGEANYSNNPTYLNYSSSVNAEGTADLNAWLTTSSFAFEENADRTIVNFVSSSASDYSASFKRQVYISRVGIYDDNKNLIGVATLSNPVRKAEDEDLTFKIKLDI